MIDKNNMSTKGKTFFAITFVLATVVLLHFLGWIGPVENRIRSILQVGTKPFYKLGSFFSDREDVGKSKDKILSELEACRTRNEEVIIDRTSLTVLEQENAELRFQLNFFSSGEYEHVGAEVIGRTVDPLGTTIILDKGFNHEIKVNNPVIVGKGLLIGKVIEVFENSSIVRLINDINSRVGATVVNNNSSIGLVEGGYGLGIHMNFIPQNEAINIGDAVISSGLTEGMPRGLVIGTIELVEKQPHEPFQQAILQPQADLSHLTLVSIIKT